MASTMDTWDYRCRMSSYLMLHLFHETQGIVVVCISYLCLYWMQRQPHPVWLTGLLADKLKTGWTSARRHRDQIYVQNRHVTHRPLGDVKVVLEVYFFQYHFTIYLELLTVIGTSKFVVSKDYFSIVFAQIHGIQYFNISKWYQNGTKCIQTCIWYKLLLLTSYNWQ